VGLVGVDHVVVGRIGGQAGNPDLGGEMQDPVDVVFTDQARYQRRVPDITDMKGDTGRHSRARPGR
jgi:hypothetical protein